MYFQAGILHKESQTPSNLFSHLKSLKAKKISKKEKEEETWQAQRP